MAKLPAFSRRVIPYRIAELLAPQGDYRAVKGIEHILETLTDAPLSALWKYSRSPGVQMLAKSTDDPDMPHIEQLVRLLSPHKAQTDEVRMTNIRKALQHIPENKIDYIWERSRVPGKPRIRYEDAHRG